MTIEFTAPAPPVVEPPPPEPLPPVVEEPPPPVVDENAVKPPPPKPVPKPKPKPKPQPRPAGAEGRRAGSARAAATRRATHPAGAGRCSGAVDAAVGERRLPAQPGAGIPRPGHAPRLGGHRAVAGACPASGSPSEIQVQKSSGREALDQAAVKAVKRWSFVPAKRGDKAEDGWVSVPIDFKLN